MKKIFTKKQNKRLIVLALGVLMLAMLVGVFALVFLDETYKPCREYKLDNEPRIAGVDKNVGYFTYLNVPSSSCRQTASPDAISFEEKGPYAEQKSCEADQYGKTYVTDSYEKCAFGCFAGNCMEKCQDPNKDNIFAKGVALGFDVKSTGLNPTTAIPSRLEDYCTDELNQDNVLLSKFLAKRVCDKNNYVNANVVECSNVCFDGACQKDAFRYCGDSDMNDKGKINGTVSYYDASAKQPKFVEDTCLDTKTVTEYFCGADKLPHRYVLNCRKSCTSGQCIQ
jgi:hypothetical protein